MYPATLRVSADGKAHFFTDAKAALKFAKRATMKRDPRKRVRFLRHSGTVYRCFPVAPATIVRSSTRVLQDSSASPRNLLQ
ncbi:hypothetical protein NDU88_006004 [Pleurodeles waltl]|uniref:Uncharacterized protein n=1 Tax=Pleurodeles waltl TaxID=8319 RepID=A0AAV7PM64_PLEWA|nr:hypothetical protein NDU88_006004 [Pleurodeles waltl]